MGIGRREFLRLFGGALAAIATPGSAAVALFDDLYVNRKLGMAFRKPKGWYFGSVRDMGRIKDGQLLDLDDKELEKELLEAIDLPIVAVTQSPLDDDSDRFTPGLTVYLDGAIEPELAELVQKDPIAAGLYDAKGSSSILKEFKVVSAPSQRLIANCSASDYTASFIFEHKNLRFPTVVRQRTLIIQQEPVWYTVRIHDAPSLGRECEVDYDEFVRSVQLV